MTTQKYQNLSYKDPSHQLQGSAVEIRKNFGPGRNDKNIKQTTTKLLCLLALVIIFFSAFAKNAQSAEIFFGAHSKEVTAGTKLEIGIFLDAQGESINALQGTIIFPSDYLELKEIHDGNSNITFWVKQPALTSKDSVLFSGVVPGGFAGDKGYLFSLVFKATKKGRITISSNDEKAYLNDGKGSLAKIKKAPLSLDIIEKKSDKNFVPLYDTNPPEPFEPQIARNENIFEGKWFLAFVAQDKSSGIDHYEVKESKRKLLSESQKWLFAKSPYLLTDQELRSYIFIKAVDRAGNERIAQTEPRNKIKWYNNWLPWLIIIIMIAIIIFTSRKLWQKKK